MHHREIFTKGPFVTRKRVNRKNTKIYHDNSFAKIQNKTKVKELLNIRINEHIANIFC